jgi:SAM-dependent methyltransferase
MPEREVWIGGMRDVQVRDVDDPPQPGLSFSTFPLQTDSTCPVCSASTTRCLYPDARDYVTRHAFQVHVCDVCRTAFTFPVPDRMDEYYPARYRRFTRPALATLKALYRIRAKGWDRSSAKPGTVLELGCGDGLMLQALAERGWRVMGTERTEESARFARESGIDVLVDSHDPWPRDRRFDLVIMFQVLEHLPDPVQRLTRCRGLLNEGGRIIVGVPNFGSWQSEWAREHWFHLDVPRHLVHLSPGALRAAAEQAGLRVESLSFRSFEHDPYGWIQSCLNVCGNENRLTRLLMRMTRFRPKDTLTLLAAGILVLPAILLSMISWGMGRGALMEATLVARRD